MTETIQSRPTVVPTWLVSARNGTTVVPHDGGRGQWRPFGLQHARQVGASLTACGLAAAEWEIFWDLPFPSEGPAICRDCRAVIDRSEVALAKLPAGASRRTS